MNAMLPSNYTALLNQLKANIRQSRQRAAMAANLEPLQLQPAFVQRPVAQLLWSHHFIVIDRLKEPRERKFYSHKALQHGWSRNTLSLQIKDRGKPSPILESDGLLPIGFGSTIDKRFLFV